MRMEKQPRNENGTQRTLKTTRRPKERPKDRKERRNSVTNTFFVSNSKKSPVMRQYSRPGIDSTPFVATAAVAKIGALTTRPHNQSIL
jgi:hypothetical protein